MVLFGRLAESGWPFYYVDAPLMTYHTHGSMLSSTAAFRDARVVAWSALSFSDPVAEEHRRHVLGEAFLSRAQANLQGGSKAQARADLARAEEFGLIGPRYRLTRARIATRSPTAAVIGAARLRRRLRLLYHR
jgi:hypothetical protein